MKIKFEIPYTPKGMRLVAQLLENLSSDEKPEKIRPVTKISTFAQLLAATTQSNIPDDVIQGVVSSVGVDCFPGLAKHVDLIPVVAEKLGL